MTATTDIKVARIRPDGAEPGVRTVPVETPVAIEYNGIGYAVMMATPTDLDDFVLGFSLSERVVESPADLLGLDIHHAATGWIARARIAPDRMAPILDRVRVRVSEGSCGLCGMESLETLARPLPALPPSPPLAAEAIFAALDNLRAAQPLNAATGGMHAAAFCDPAGAIVVAREDVGRHCALDKLIGALARAGIAPATGFFLLSSRCSYELVEKAVVTGCPALVTISTATSLAVSKAATAGLQLFALARPDMILGIAELS